MRAFAGRALIRWADEGSKGFLAERWHGRAWVAAHMCARECMRVCVCMCVVGHALGLRSRGCGMGCWGSELGVSRGQSWKVLDPMKQEPQEGRGWGTRG